MKKLLLPLVAVFTLSVHAGDPMSSSHNWNIGSTNDAVTAHLLALSVPVYDALLADAKSEQSKAKALEFEWRDIGKFMKDAAKAQAAGDWATAQKLLTKAAEQGRLGQKQAADQANAGPSY
ncbi:MAG TPA: hypothetical protein EYP92_04195 [Candidatus Thioglobus sp.]|jgi:hypothetical protein|nr:hypothetical protein [Candidatus Thioglobus sp.]HIL42190.1 hypothetical protein [Gammaproteobacteria bacterium]